MAVPTYEQVIEALRPPAGGAASDTVLEILQLLGDLAHLERRIRELLPKLVPIQRDEVPWEEIAREAEKTDSAFARAIRSKGPVFATAGVAGVARGLDGDQSHTLIRDIRIDSETWYQKAHRLLDLPDVECRVVRLVRNHLIEHPDKPNHSRVTHPSFAWSGTAGPQVKGVRVAGQDGFNDPGLFVNSEAFRVAVGKALSNPGPAKP